MTMVVSLSEPSFLDSMFSRKMTEFDFRAEGFGIIELVGPMQFKWEMCLSEDGTGDLNGKLTVTVGGWKEKDRFGESEIKSCHEPNLRRKRLVAANK